jgi:uncharacterized protein DUF4124
LTTFAAVLLVLIALTANAQVYKSITPDGRVTYGDKPVSGATVSEVDVDKGPIGIMPVAPEDREHLVGRLEQQRALEAGRTRTPDQTRRTR